jgi:hypothetical protein
MAHLLPIFLTIMWQHVRDYQAATRLERAMCLGQRRAGIGQMVQHQQQGCRIQLVVGDWQSFQFATTDLNGWEIPEPATGRLEHFCRSIDRNDARNEWRERARDLAGAAPEIPNRPSLVCERR